MFAHLNTVLTNVSIMLVHLSYFCHSGAMEVFYGALNLWSFGFGKSGILSLIFQQRSWKSLLCICRKAKSNKFVNSTQKLGRGESGCGLVAYTSKCFMVEARWTVQVFQVAIYLGIVWLSVLEEIVHE